MKDSSEKLKREIAKFFRKGRHRAISQGIDLAPGCAFGAVMEQRLRELEQSVSELKGRLNGLIFLVLGAVVVEIIMRLF